MLRFFRRGLERALTALRRRLVDFLDLLFFRVLRRVERGSSSRSAAESLELARLVSSKVFSRYFSARANCALSIGRPDFSYLVRAVS